MSDAKQYDLVIIGSGPGGYVAAIRASQLGLKAVVVEKDKAGGVCLNIGCIPSKALIHQAEVFHSIAGLEDLGVSVNTEKFDYSKVFKKSRNAASKLSRGVQYLLKKNKVDFIEGRAEISGKNEVLLDSGDKIKAKNIIIASGSRPREIPGFSFDGDTVVSSNDALMFESLPKSLLILGAGAIGMEFAHIMSRFGVEVTVVEMLDRILPLEDAEASDVVAKDFKKRGITMYTGMKASGLKKSKSGATVTLEDSDGGKKTVEAEKVLVAVGRAPNTEDIGLDSVGIETEKGFIPVGDYYLTKVPGIYAIGDVVAGPLLAHVASKEGEIAVEHIAGENPEPRLDPHLIPSAVYTEPQVAGFGLTEAQAKEQKINFKTAVFPYRGAGKAVAVEEPEGIVKIIYNPDSTEILGAHAAGANATELIHELLLAKKAELLPEDIATMVHAHPTLSEAVMEAARTAEGWVIHV